MFRISPRSSCRRNQVTTSAFEVCGVTLRPIFVVKKCWSNLSAIVKRNGRNRGAVQSFDHRPAVYFPGRFVHVRVNVVRGGVVGIVLTADREGTVPPCFLIVNGRSAVVVWEGAIRYYWLGQGRQSFSGAFHGHFFTSASGQNIAFTTFLSTLHAGSSTMAPSGAKVFLVIVTVVLFFTGVRLYYCATGW